MRLCCSISLPNNLSRNLLSAWISSYSRRKSLHFFNLIWIITGVTLRSKVMVISRTAGFRAIYFAACISTRPFWWSRNLTGVQNKISWRSKCLWSVKLHHISIVILCANSFVTSFIIWDNTTRTVPLSVAHHYIQIDAILLLYQLFLKNLLVCCFSSSLLI